MKNLISRSLVCISAAILLSACGHSLSLTKRHYRNGYHYEHAGKTTTPRINTVSETKRNHEESKIREEVITVAPTRTIETIPVTSSKTQADSFIKRAAFSPKTDLTASATDVTLGKPVIKQQVQNIKTQMKSGDRDGLSLFWLVILIIIIIWAFGFLAGGWGLGGLINLLLLIALILLILWLLRII